MCLQVAELPALAIAVKIASSLKRIASFAYDVAFFPGIAVHICSAVAWRRAALVGCRVAVFECRIALGVRIAIARRCPAVVFHITYLPALAVGICPAFSFLEYASVAVLHIASCERIPFLAGGVRRAIAGESSAGSGRLVAVLPFKTIGIFTAVC